MSKELESLLEKFTTNGFNAKLVKNKQEALNEVKNFLLPNISVGFGGSVTIEEIGVFDYLKTRSDLTLYNQYEAGIDKEENTNRRRLGILSDVYLTSCNAVSEDEGYLVNADGSGNRVAAMIYGPKQVVLVIGKNKISKTKEDAFTRLENVAAVKNVDRLNEKAATFNKPQDHNIDSVLCKYTLIKKDLESRINIILVEENLGY